MLHSYKSQTRLIENQSSRFESVLSRAGQPAAQPHAHGLGLRMPGEAGGWADEGSASEFGFSSGSVLSLLVLLAS